MEAFYLKYVGPLVDFLSTEVPPGPKVFPIKFITNIQKGATCLWVLFLMWSHNNWGVTPFVYLSLHGTYGILWLMKDRIFPDPSFERKQTILSTLVAAVSVLGPYWLSPWFLITRRVEASPALLCFCIALHTIGVVTMMAADTQKFFTLKYKKGLISEGWFYNCRNPNYLGEMMLYSSYAILSRHPVPVGVLLWVWSLLFATNVIRKEASLRSKDGWDEYRRRSWLLFPRPSFLAEQDSTKNK